MRSRPLTALLLALVALGPFAAGPARAGNAGDCAPEAPAEASARHEFVFLGLVESVNDSTFAAPTKADGAPAVTRQFARVRMLSLWKGLPLRDLVLVAEDTGGRFGIPRFTPGAEYVVYADRTRLGWEVRRCSRTRLLGQADADVAALGTPAPVPPLVRHRPLPH